MQHRRTEPASAHGQPVAGGFTSVPYMLLNRKRSVARSGRRMLMAVRGKVGGQRDAGLRTSEGLIDIFSEKSAATSEVDSAWSGVG